MPVPAMPSGTPDRTAADGIAAAQLEMDDVFKALADPTRRQLLDNLKARSGQTLRELCADLTMARQSVSKHLAILEEANLIATVRHGREKLHYLNPAPINDITERWINQYDQPRIDALTDLKHALEGDGPPVTKPDFVYTSYIRTTPEQLWDALTKPEFTQQYWNVGLITDWQVGSAVTWDNHGITIVDPEQVVLAYEPHTRLAYTWHSFTDEWAAVYTGSADEVAQLRAEARSTATFELEDVGDGLVKLTVIHGRLDPGGLIASMVSQGWPRVISDLKTFVEASFAPPDTTI